MHEPFLVADAAPDPQGRRHVGRLSEPLPRSLEWLLGTGLLVVAALAFEAIRDAHSVVLIGATPEKMFAGSAVLPFQHRYLVPLLARAWAVATGHLAGDHTALFVWIDRGAVLLALFATLLLLRSFRLSPVWLGVLYLMMLANYAYASPANYFDTYDMPALLFAALGMWLIHERRWAGYLAVLPIAMLNRETALSLVVLFALTQHRTMPSPRYWALLAAQLILCGAVKLMLLAAFPQKSGLLDSFWSLDALGRHFILHDNLVFLTDPHALPAFGFMWIPFGVALFRLRNPFLRRAVWLVPIFMGGMLFGGNFFEFRIFSELLPLMTVTIGAGFQSWRVSSRSSSKS